MQHLKKAYPVGFLALFLVLLLVLTTGNAHAASYISGKHIVISLSRQHLDAYDNGANVISTDVTTGQPTLPTPLGTYSVIAKASPTTFYSPWPYGSPYYYPPTYVNYALEFQSAGYFIHDATWRSDFGPGTNVWHYDHLYGWETGSHGCVNLPLGVMARLYRWAPLGTTVQVVP